GAGIRERTLQPSHARIVPWQFRFAAYRPCPGLFARLVASPQRRLARYVVHRLETGSLLRSVGLLAAVGRKGGIPSPALNPGSAVTGAAEQYGGVRPPVRNVVPLQPR